MTIMSSKTDKCSIFYENKKKYNKFSGVLHYLHEKTIYTTVHPFWLIILYVFSTQLTNSNVEICIIVTSAFYSILFEFMNSAVEETNDRFGCEYSIHTKKAKELMESCTALSRLPTLAVILSIIYRNYMERGTIFKY